MSGRTAFLDRDGTINVKPPDDEYVTSLAEFHYLPGAEEAIRLLANGGWRVVVVTNQRGIALRRMTAEDVDRIHRVLMELPVAAVYVCPHEKGTCDCRKPGRNVQVHQSSVEFRNRRAVFPTKPSVQRQGRADSPIIGHVPVDR